jgi:alternate signal-mediated exported protein
MALVGGTIAFNSTNWSFNNLFEVGEFKTEVSEVFDSPDNWKPCEETPKLVTLRNTGNVDAKVRVQMDQFWTAKDGTELPLIDNNMTLAQINFVNASAWTLNDGYYYLNDDLEAGHSVQFMSSVTYNCDANYGKNTMIDGDGVATSTPDSPYNGASYSLNITAQFLQADADTTWDEAFNGYKPPHTFALLAGGFGQTFRNTKSDNCASNGAPRAVSAFKRSKVLPQSFDANMCQSDISDATETTPIYLWYDPSDTTIYWYSTADAVTLNSADSTVLGGMFTGAFFTSKPDTVSGFEYFDMHNLRSIGGFISSGSAAPDDMSYLSHWDLSGITGGFSGGLCNLKDSQMSMMEHWNVSNVTSLAGTFCGGSPDVTSLEMLANWDVSHVTSMGGTFSNFSSVTSLHGLENWNVSNVTTMGQTFMNMSSLTDISAISRWNTAAVTSLAESFKGTTSLTNASAINPWGTKFSGTPDKTDMFSGSGVTTFPTWY